MNNTRQLSPVLELFNVQRSFPQGKGVITVVREANLTIYPGELVALVGPSGSGKSTLLHIAGLLDTPSQGSIRIAGKDMTTASDAMRTLCRRQSIGFVYQFHHLLPELTALENVALPLLISGAKLADATRDATTMLEALGLGPRLSHYPPMLSGGEQQRVAIARALVTSPQLLLADEPTGNLDPDTGMQVFDVMMHLAKACNLGGIVVTHNLQLAKKMHRQVTLIGGVLTEVN
jgi:lipoprotein-releasing system ATP-binding protein